MSFIASLFGGGSSRSSAPAAQPQPQQQQQAAEEQKKEEQAAVNPSVAAKSLALYNTAGGSRGLLGNVTVGRRALLSGF